MRNLLFILLFVLAGCQASGGGGSDPIVGHVPVVNKFTVTTSLNQSYNSGDIIDFTFTFPSAVTVTGTPDIGLTIGGSSVVASYLSGSGSTALILRYTVLPGDNDADGISMASSINLNGGTLTFSSINCNTTITPPNLTTVLVDTTLPTLTSVTAVTNGTYGIAQNLDFTATFSEAMTVSGSPRIALNIGGVTRYATYLSGTGTGSIVFRYSIVSGELDADGIGSSSPIDLNAGAITDIAGNAPASLAFTAPNTAGVLVDGVPPTITGASGPSNNTYIEGQNLDFVLTFSKIVTVTGSPRVELNIGGDIVYAVYVSGAGTASLTFRYVVEAGDTDLDGISASSPLQLNSGNIRDSVNNTVSPLTYTPPNTTLVLVDANGATISSITPPANGTYQTGAPMDFLVNYSRLVNVTGTPRIQLNTGGSTLYANYISGTGTTALTFRYTVGPGASDSDGIGLVSPLQLNGGTIKDSGTVNAGLTFTSPNTTLVLVDGIDIVISSITPPADATYGIGDNVEFTVNYNYPAYITGSPRITLTVGAATLYATYVSGSGTASHLMRYTVSIGDTDTNGIDTQNNIDLNGGTIKDSFGDNAIVTFTGQNYPNKRVDGIRPVISNMTVSANATYKLAATIDFTASYSEVVTITGSPRLPLTIGSTTRYATYISGSGSSTIIFRYTVLVGDEDTNGISASGSVDLNTGTIRDGGANDQTNLAYTPPVLTGVLVDGIVPYITSINAPADQTFKNGAVISFTVNFSENVTIGGSPYLTLVIGGTNRSAVYSSGSGGTAIVFQYTTIAPDLDSDGLNTSSPLVLSGGSIRDAALNSADLIFTSLNYSGLLVDAVIPTVSSVTLPSNNTYKNGGTRPTLSFTVVFTEVVNVTGTPRIVLTIGANTRFANYVSGTGTTSLVFTYNVATSDLDLDGIEIGNIGDLDENGGSIRDAALNDADPGLGSNNLSKVFAVYPSMRSWYDLSDSTKITLAGANITGLTDKIGTFNYTHTGIPYSSSGFNGGSNAFASCASASAFVGSSTTTPVAMVAVFRAPPNVTNQFLFQANSTTRPQVQFTSTAGGGTVDFGINGSQFESGAWGASGATATNVWSTNSYHARGFWWNGTQTRTPSLCKMTGQIAEVFFFTSQPSPAEMTEIESYINVRYSLNFP